MGSGCDGYFSGMQFSVDQEEMGSWTPIAITVEAGGGRQAVARAAGEPGLYRVNPLGTRGLNETFLVPDWGVPRRVPVRDANEPPNPPRAAIYEAVREAAALAGIRARLGRARALRNRTRSEQLRARSARARRLRAASAAAAVKNRGETAGTRR